MIGDVPVKIRQTIQKDTYLMVFLQWQKIPQINSNIANKFSSDVGKQLLIANDRNRVRWLVLVLLKERIGLAWICMKIAARII
jgi:hypothetical protein